MSGFMVPDAPLGRAASCVEHREMQRRVQHVTGPGKG